MKKKTYLILLLLLAVFLILIGIYNTYLLWWNNNVDKSPIVVIISFFSLGGSAMIISYILTCLVFVPKNIQFDFLALADKRKFLELAKEIGDKKAHQLILKNMILYIIIFLSFGFALVISLKEYEIYQLSHFGLKKEVEIKLVGKSLKGLKKTVINYEYNFQNYTKELYLNGFKKGEKHFIIFSKSNPNIMVWFDEYSQGLKL